MNAPRALRLVTATALSAALLATGCTFGAGAAGEGVGVVTARGKNEGGRAGYGMAIGMLVGLVVDIAIFCEASDDVDFVFSAPSAERTVGR